MTSPPESIVRAAYDALVFSMAEMRTESAECLATIAGGGPRDVHAAMWGWCTSISTLAEFPAAGPDEFWFIEVTDTRTGADASIDRPEINDSERDVLRLVTAQCNGDQNTFAALVAVIYEAGVERLGDVMLGLLNLTAQAVKLHSARHEGGAR